MKNDVIDLQTHELTQRMNEAGVPEHLHHGIVLYILHNIEPGGFLSAVICNDLKEAVNRADRVNIQRIPEIVRFFYWHAPSICWGSPEKFEAWLSKRST